MDMTLKKMFTILFRNLLLILLCTIIGGTAGYVVSRFIVDPTYQSSAKLCVLPGENDVPSNANLNTLNYSQQIVKTYIEILNSNSFYVSILDEAQLKDTYTPAQLQKMVTFTIMNQTTVFQITVRADSPEHAKRLADAAAAMAPVQITKAKSAATVSLVDPAVEPTVPSSPNIRLNTVIGAILGMAIAVLIAFLREMLDTRIHSQEELAAAFDIPILGTVPDFSTSKKKH